MRLLLAEDEREMPNPEISDGEMPNSEMKNGMGRGKGFEKGGGMSAVSENAVIEINGGNIYINADGDGLDSNGSLIINGGKIYVDGPENNGNGALDYGITAKINGGIFAATGMSGMAESFDAYSTQCSILVCFDETLDGEKIVLTDESGNEILSYTCNKKFNSVVISSSELKQGEGYTITAGQQKKTVTLTEMNYRENNQKIF